MKILESDYIIMLHKLDEKLNNKTSLINPGVLYLVKKIKKEIIQNKICLDKSTEVEELKSEELREFIKILNELSVTIDNEALGNYKNQTAYIELGNRLINSDRYKKLGYLLFMLLCTLVIGAIITIAISNPPVATLLVGFYIYASSSAIGIPLILELTEEFDLRSNKSTAVSEAYKAFKALQLDSESASEIDDRKSPLDR